MYLHFGVVKVVRDLKVDMGYRMTKVHNTEEVNPFFFYCITQQLSA